MEMQTTSYSRVQHFTCFTLTIVDTYEYFIKNPDSQNIKQHYDEAK